MRVPAYLGEGNRYRIEAEIGRGGMGSVYRAEDKNTGKRVAIKIMLDGANPEAESLFEKEWKILADLQHPNIIGITDKGEFREGGDRHPFFVMPFLKGKTLYELIHSQEESLSVERVVAIITATAESLYAAHLRNVIHRDIKPSNIFVLESGPVVVIDFGVAHLSENRMGTTLKGTTPYMAPELLDPTRNQNPSELSDLFSLGVVCYEALTGKHPFARTTDRETRMAVLREIPVPAFEVNRTLTLLLSQVVQKAMAKDRRHRYQSVKEFAEKLERAFRSEPMPEFEKQAIENKLRVVRDALSRGQTTSADEMMRSIEEDGFIDPAISVQRQRINQALQQKWVRDQLDSAKLYREAGQHSAAVEKLNEILLKVPGDIEAQRELDSILEERYGKLLTEARGLISRHQFTEARTVLQEAAAIQPRDTRSADLLEELTQTERTDREFAERKADLFDQAQKEYRDGHAATALRKLEQLMAAIRQSPMSSPERDPIYTSFYEVVTEENNRLVKASEEVRRCLAAGKSAEAIVICEQVLAANPGNSEFEALKIEAESQEQQSRMDFVNHIRVQLDTVQDLDLRVKILQEAANRYPDESQLTGLLRSAKAKRDFVSNLITRARNAEAPGRHAIALELWNDVRKHHPTLEGLDEQIRRVEKLCETEVHEENRIRKVQEVADLLRAGEYERAAERSNAALAEFPSDDELLAYHVEAKERALRVPEIQRLIEEGRGLLREGNHDTALEVLRRAANLDRNHQQVRQSLGLVLIDKGKAMMAAGNVSYANQLFGEARTLLPENSDVKEWAARVQTPKPSETVEQCIAAARELSSAGKLDAALARIRESLKNNSGDSRLMEESNRIRKLMGGQSSDGDKTIMETRMEAYQSSLDSHLLSQEPIESPPPIEPVTPASKPSYFSLLLDSAGALWTKLRKQLALWTETGVPAIQSKWEELRPFHKRIYAALLIVFVAAVGTGAILYSGGPGSPVVKTVSLDIVSNPPGAEIRIGDKTGTSKLHLDLKPGNYDATVSMAGYEPRLEHLALGSEHLTRELALTPLPMNLRVIAPANVKGTVSVDGEPRGELAGAEGLLISRIPPGTYKVQIVSDTRPTIEATIQLEPGHPPVSPEKPAASKALFFFVGSLNEKVHAECNCPSGSQMTMGGSSQAIGSAGVEITKPRGSQQVDFSGPGGNIGGLTLADSSNPSALIALYNWQSTQTTSVQTTPVDSFEADMKEASSLYKKLKYNEALTLVRKMKSGNEAKTTSQKERLNGFETLILNKLNN